MEIPRRYIPSWAWPLTAFVSSGIMFGGTFTGQGWLVALGLIGLLYTAVGYGRDVALYKPDLGDLTAVNGTEELEDRRHANFLKSQQDLYIKSRVHLRNYIIKQMGFSGQKSR